MINTFPILCRVDFQESGTSLVQMGEGSDTVWVGKAENPVRDLTDWEDATKPATYAAADHLFKNSLGAKTGGNHLVSGSSVGIGMAYCLYYTYSIV